MTALHSTEYDAILILCYIGFCLCLCLSLCRCFGVELLKYERVILLTNVAIFARTTHFGIENKQWQLEFQHIPFDIGMCCRW